MSNFINVAEKKVHNPVLWPVFVSFIFYSFVPWDKTSNLVSLKAFVAFLHLAITSIKSLILSRHYPWECLHLIVHALYRNVPW